MRTSSVTKAKNGLSALIDQVRAGETILLLDRGYPVARLEPVSGHEDRTGRVARLERTGILRVGAARPPLDLLHRPAPTLTPGTSAVRALIEERTASR
jgi:antitoxin (DNA-binding transcriptional repressor) of toxin-antitoxin stability system